MLLQRTTSLLLDNPTDDYIRVQCIPIVERFLKVGLDLTFLVGPILEVIGRFSDEKLARLLFERHNAVTDVVIARPPGLEGSLSLEQTTELVS